MDPKKEYFNPKTGENHGIFGYKYLKFHRMRDPKWTAGDKMIQYVGITKIYDRHRKLQTLKTIIARKKKQQYNRKIKNMLNDDIGYFQLAKAGDAQRIKNILQGHYEMQRAYQPLSIEVEYLGNSNSSFVNIMVGRVNEVYDEMYEREDT